MSALQAIPSNPTLPFTIVPANWRDVRETRALEKVCFGPDAWSYFEIFLSLVQPGGVRLKAQDLGQMVGMVLGEARPFEGVGWIASLCVHPHYQRRGIGRALLSACEAALPQSVIKLTVRKSNSKAIALYRQSGYERVAVWEHYYGGGEEGIVMEKSKRG